MTDARCFRCGRRLQSQRAERRGYCAPCWKYGLGLLEASVKQVPLDVYALDAMWEVVLWSLGTFVMQGDDLGLLALMRRLSEGIDRQDRPAVRHVVDTVAQVIALSIDALAAPTCAVYHLCRLYALTGRARTGHVVTLRLGAAALEVKRRRIEGL